MDKIKQLEDEIKSMTRIMEAQTKTIADQIIVIEAFNKQALVKK